MSNWFREGLDEFMMDLAVDAGVTQEAATKVYASLNHYGIIDYDIIKEFIREEYTEMGIEEDE